MDQWPQDISIDAFRRTWVLEGEPLWRRVFDTHRDKMQIKNPQVAVGNLEKIFTCTFRLANSKGFQAMSLRDLSRETGISMGGLYAYIGSKDDLASAIEEVLRITIDDVMSDKAVLDLGPLHRLKAIIYGDIYMNDIMHPWYYFCYLEAKGLSREQREAAMQMEVKFDERLQETFAAGVAAGLFKVDKIALLAANTTSMLQQWYLKRWKFQLMGTRIDEYAAFVYDTTLRNLGYDPA
ncbi:MAG: TetR/AcrR family transcriptional regulator [Pseudohongiellaceae bacterium]